MISDNYVPEKINEYNAYMDGEKMVGVVPDVDLPEMIDTAETDLEALTGIGPDSYDSAVCYRLCEGTAPDEIIIVRSWDEETAGSIQELLEKRLDYKQESGQLYLTEYQPILQAGIVRRDGLTVSLIVSDQLEDIMRVYDSLG